MKVSSELFTAKITGDAALLKINSITSTFEGVRSQFPVTIALKLIAQNNLLIAVIVTVDVKGKGGD